MVFGSGCDLIGWAARRPGRSRPPKAGRAVTYEMARLLSVEGRESISADGPASARAWARPGRQLSLRTSAVPGLSGSAPKLAGLKQKVAHSPVKDVEDPASAFRRDANDANRPIADLGELQVLVAG